MNTTEWLGLTEYSGKYGVSISTLRRRIKTGEIEFRFEDGKYLLKNAPIRDQQTLNHVGATVAKAPPHKTSGHELAPQSSSSEAILKADLTDADEGSPLLLTANRLLNELKKAYSLILQEKEEQIFQLRDEVADLKTLVRVLEEENQRLKNENNKPGSKNFGDDWLAGLEK